MLIVLDSNILCSDFYMKNLKFELINKVGTIVLGEIVVDEVCNKYREYLLANYEALKKSLNNINKVIPKPVHSIDISIEYEVKRYRDFLEMLSIQNEIIYVDNYPTVSHKEIVTRALMRKKPFKQDGSTGYRDYLVWTTCLEIAKNYAYEEIHFITQNVNDFSDLKNKKILHSDLMDDLKQYGIDASRFHYWISINEFVENHIQPSIDKLENKAKITSQIESSSEYYRKIKSFIDDSVIGICLSSCEVLLPGNNIVLKKVDELDTDIEEISPIDDDNYLLEIKVDSFCLVEAEMRLEDYYNIDNSEEWDDVLWDVTLKKKYDNGICLVQMITTLYIHLNGKYNISNDSINTIQLDYIKDNNCDYCN